MLARPDLPFIKPHSQSIGFEPLGQLANRRFILAAMAQEHVVFEILVALHWQCP
jgi:hypothetical protein